MEKKRKKRRFLKTIFLNMVKNIDNRKIVGKKFDFQEKKRRFQKKNNKFDFPLFLDKKSKKNSIVIFRSIFRGFRGPYSNVIKNT